MLPAAFYFRLSSSCDILHRINLQMKAGAGKAGEQKKFSSLRFYSSLPTCIWILNNILQKIARHRFL